MSREKQIEEMANDLEVISYGSGNIDFYRTAEIMYRKGYRKRREGENVSGTPSLYECSVCHWSDWDTTTADTSEYNYCPNCGARMIIEQKYTEDNQ